jgi:uncharacterized protein
MGDELGADALQVLTTQQCYALLATQEFGRLGVWAEHYPLIIPVNYGLDGEVLVVRTHPGPTLAAADHANVTFEVDAIDPGTRSGWSVLVRGLAEEVTDRHHEDLVARTTRTGVEPWAPGEHGRWLRIITHDVSGRRIRPGVLPGGPQPA